MGRKLFVWGGLPGETVEVRITKKKSKFAEGVVTRVVTASPGRIAPRDPDSYLSTSPWQIMTADAEQIAKNNLIEAAFALHNLRFPQYPLETVTDGVLYGYRNKVEFSWWWDKDTEQIADLAFYRRGTHGKIAVDGTSLAHPSLNTAAQNVRDLLRSTGVGGKVAQDPPCSL